MKSFVTKNCGRTIVFHLTKGDKLQESLCEELARLGVKNAILTSMIGSLRKLSIHIITEVTDVSKDAHIDIEGAIELGVGQGMVLDGVPHFHVVCSTPDGKTHVGHLENGSEVQYLIEASFVEIDGLSLTRKKDQFGNVYIDQA